MKKDSLQQFSTDSLYKLVRSNRYKNPLRAKTYVLSYYKRVRDQGNYAKAFNAACITSVVYNTLGQKDSAHFYVDEAAQIALQANDEKKYYSSLNIKGSICFSYDDFANALSNYKQAYVYFEKENNINKLAQIRHNMALIENQIGRRKQALLKVKENLRLYDEGVFDKKKRLAGYLNTLLSVSNVYTTIADDYTEERTQYLDSAMSYNKLGLDKSFEINNLEMYSFFLTVQGIIFQKRGNFSKAFKDLDDAEKLILKLGLNNQLSIVYLHKGKNYFIQNEIDEALPYLLKTDSIITKDNTYSQNLQETYILLAQSYEKKEDVKTASKYWNIFQKKTKENDKLMRQVSEELYKKYDVPSFIKRIELLQKEAEDKQFLSTLFINISIVLVLLFIAGFWYYKNRERTFKKRFDIVLNELKAIEKSQKRVESKTAQTYVITDENIQKILDGLEKFEKKEQFLQKKCTLNYVAKKINTNSTYLSKTLQSHKQKKFVQYITDLRLEYALKRLKNDTKFRTYDIKSIASELGFNTAESFSKAFKKRTGIYPSFYIKNLNKLSTDQGNS
ncbi:helix-turn-helix domain-containing protein [Kordia sp.]|uniref:helix-turn-helix domain-containing protein n=1 Tax=Kordia sp. TaxID=1965332 RepID=UPI0025BAD192|nr:helix-turn-helix domain-containing protein [Kordia sp.]MCH2192923.1 helix-turn-helix domain-containing protein [Kordia sp.]